MSDDGRMEQPGQQQMQQHGCGASLDQRGEEGRRKRPGDAGEDAHTAAVGDPCGGEPSAEHGQRQGQQPEQDHRERRRTRPERADDRDDAGERIGGSGEPDADVALTPGCVVPEGTDGVAERKQRPTAESGPGEQGRERGDADDEGAEHRPGASAGEEVELADRAAFAAVTVVEATPQLAPGDAQRGDARPRGRADRADAASRLGDGAEAHQLSESCAPFGEDGCRPLGDQVHDGAPQCQRKQRQPVQRNDRGRCVGESPVQLCDPGDVCPRCRAAREGGGAVRAHRDPRARRENHAAAAETCAHAEVEALVCPRQSGVGQQMLAHLAADEHAADVGSEHVVAPVMLILIELAGSEFHRSAELSHRDAEAHEFAVIVDVDELRRGDGGGGRPLKRTGEVAQSVRMRCGVVPKQPDGRAVFDPRLGELHGVCERRAAACLDDTLSGASDRLALARCGSISAHHEGDGVGSARLQCQCIDGAQKLGVRGRAGTRDDDGMDSGWHGEVSLCADPEPRCHGARCDREAVVSRLPGA